MGLDTRSRRCGTGRRIGASTTYRYPGAAAVHGVGERGLARALDAQALDVDVGRDELPVAAEALALGQQHAVLGDQQVPAEDQVGRRLVDSGVGVGVGRERAARLLAHQLAAVLCLARRGRSRPKDSGSRSPPPPRAGARRIGAHRSSQISTATSRPAPRSRNSRSVPNGTSGPRAAASPSRASRATRTSAPRSTPCSRAGTSSARRPAAARLQHRRGVEEAAALQHRQPDHDHHRPPTRLARHPLERTLRAPTSVEGLKKRSPQM